MQIRVGIAVKSKELSDMLVKSVVAFSLSSVSGAGQNAKTLDVETDISFYEDDFEQIKNGYLDIDIAFFDRHFVNLYKNRLWELYQVHTSCMPVLAFPPKADISRYLELRPIACVNSENTQAEIEKLCRFCAECLSSTKEVFQLSTKKGTKAISISSILYCQSDLKYVMIVTSTGESFRKLGKLDEIARQLPSNFIRIHQSFLVNPRHMTSLDKSTWEIVLEPGVKLPVSRTYRPTVGEIFQNCTFSD